MVCTRKTKTLVSTCVILSGMTNIVCLLYVGWVTNYIASVYVKVQEPISEKKLEEGKEDTLRIIERLDHLENVIKQHIQGTTSLLVPALLSPSPHPAVFYARSPVPSRRVRAACVCAGRGGRAASGEGPLLCPETAGAPPRLRCVWGCPAVPGAGVRPALPLRTGRGRRRKGAFSPLGVGARCRAGGASSHLAVIVLCLLFFKMRVRFLFSSRVSLSANPCGVCVCVCVRLRSGFSTSAAVVPAAARGFNWDSLSFV